MNAQTQNITLETLMEKSREINQATGSELIISRMGERTAQICDFAPEGGKVLQQGTFGAVYMTLLALENGIKIGQATMQNVRLDAYNQGFDAGHQTGVKHAENLASGAYEKGREEGFESGVYQSNLCR